MHVIRNQHSIGRWSNKGVYIPISIKISFESICNTILITSRDISNNSTHSIQKSTYSENATSQLSMAVTYFCRLLSASYFCACTCTATRPAHTAQSTRRHLYRRWVLQWTTSPSIGPETCSMNVEHLYTQISLIRRQSHSALIINFIILLLSDAYRQMPFQCAVPRQHCYTRTSECDRQRWHGFVE